MPGSKLTREWRRLVRRLNPERAAAWAALQPALAGARGIEIGGPSWMFGDKGLLPVYAAAGRIDNCNFGAQTVWEGAIDTSRGFAPRGVRLGDQHVSEATQLRFALDASCDFVLSSHALEHCANPIKALREWQRVLRDGGVLVLVLPHGEATFDHRRPVTPLAHLIDDFTADRTEDDLTHFDEILALHDPARDPGALDADAFRERSLRNAENRCFHHHVFDSTSVVRLLDQVGFEIQAVETFRPDHIVTVSRWRRSVAPANQRWLAAKAPYRQASVFERDRDRDLNPSA
jgi:SAM-dependent methyltransferase